MPNFSRKPKKSGGGRPVRVDYVGYDEKQRQKRKLDRKKKAQERAELEKKEEKKEMRAARKDTEGWKRANETLERIEAIRGGKIHLLANADNEVPKARKRRRDGNETGDIDGGSSDVDSNEQSDDVEEDDKGNEADVVVALEDEKNTTRIMVTMDDEDAVEEMQKLMERTAKSRNPVEKKDSKAPKTVRKKVGGSKKSALVKRRKKTKR